MIYNLWKYETVLEDADADVAWLGNVNPVFQEARNILS